MFKIADGRDCFYQWDLDRMIVIEDRTITEVHFCNKTDDCALVTIAYEDEGLWVADVPNILLQDAWDIRVYGRNIDYTKCEKRFKVKARSKPSDYIYTETELKNYDDLELRHKQDIYRLGDGLSTTSKNATMAQQAADTAQQIAVNAGQTAYAVKQTLDYVIEPNLATHEERLDAIEALAGDIENALNEITTLQESYIGG